MSDHETLPGVPCPRCSELRDARILARHIEITAAHHPRGCLCPECSELRAAVGGGKRMDKHLARLQEAKRRGKTAAEQAITAQRRREAGARAEVTRELAGYGAYPYRDSGCEKPAKRRPVRYDKPVTARPALDKAVLTPEQEITAEIYEPLGLDYSQLAAAFPDQPPDACGNCRTGPLFAGFRCSYCHALDELAARPAPPRRDRPVNVTALLTALLASAVFWTIAVLIATGALG